MRRHWRRTLVVTLTLLVLWLLVTVVTSFLPGTLNQWRFMGFPLGFYFAAQGALLVFLAIVGVHTVLMNRLDRSYREERKAADQA